MNNICMVDGSATAEEILVFLQNSMQMTSELPEIFSRNLRGEHELLAPVPGKISEQLSVCQGLKTRADELLQIVASQRDQSETICRQASENVEAAANLASGVQQQLTAIQTELEKNAAVRQSLQDADHDLQEQLRSAQIEYDNRIAHYRSVQESLRSEERNLENSDSSDYMISCQKRIVRKRQEVAQTDQEIRQLAGAMNNGRDTAGDIHRKMSAAEAAEENLSRQYQDLDGLSNTASENLSEQENFLSKCQAEMDRLNTLFSTLTELCNRIAVLEQACVDAEEYFVQRKTQFLQQEEMCMAIFDNATKENEGRMKNAHAAVSNIRDAAVRYEQII